MIKTIILNGREVYYELQRKKVKNINLRIKADQSISVSANTRVSAAVIENFLISKADYILKALDYYAKRANDTPKPRNYIDGETVSVLGQKLILRVVQGARNIVETDGTYITLTVKEISDFEMKKRTMDMWLKQQCKEVLQSVCEAVYPKFQKYGIGFPQLRFRKMVSRWGSCQPQSGILTFNTVLVETPMECIEYVVMHEFTHFLHPNHSKKFYQQLSIFMPDWAERRKLLERYNDCCRAK